MRVNLKEFGLEDKLVNIPDDEIARISKGLQVDATEAMMVYLEDEGYLDNEEQEALDKKAKDNRITATIHQAKSEGKKKREYERKKEKMKINNEKNGNNET